MQSQYVTPSLYVGAMPSRLSRTARVTSADEAVQVIHKGGVAVLPDGCWAEAETVLERLGLEQTQRTSALRFAKTATLG